MFEIFFGGGRGGLIYVTAYFQGDILSEFYGILDMCTMYVPIPAYN